MLRKILIIKRPCYKAKKKINKNIIFYSCYYFSKSSKSHNQVKVVKIAVCVCVEREREREIVKMSVDKVPQGTIVKEDTIGKLTKTYTYEDLIAFESPNIRSGIGKQIISTRPSQP
jgi:hypothetical protein